jgi:GWxTD domain-containing protein
MKPLRLCEKLLAGLTIGVMLSTAGAHAFAGQEEKKEKKPRKKIEVDQIYKKWIQEDVDYIITPEERAAFKKLQTDEEREQFIEQFWLRRDPDPDTNENEYKEEFYRRIAYANDKFTSGKPGYRTDRGRIYITFGPPDSIESHPAGGPYERPSYEGGGSTSTYPFEIWFYRYLEGVGSGVEIEFVDPTGSGEYRIANSPDEKDALLFVPNAGLTLSEQLGLSSKVDRPFFSPGNANRGGRLFGQRAQDQPFERLAQRVALERAPAVKFKNLAEKVDQEIQFDVLPFEVRTDYLRAGESSIVTTFTMLFQNTDLGFKNVGGVQQANINVFARITALSGKRAGVFEEAPVIAYQEMNFEAGLKQSSVYQKSVILPAGNYKIDFVVRDVTSGRTGIVRQGFEVPRYAQESMATSSLIIADVIEPVVKAGGSQFIIGANKVRPSVTQRFKQSQNLGLYMQVYNVQIDQTTLRPALDVEYVVMRGGKEVMRIKEDGQNGISDLSGYSQQIVLGRLISLKDFEPGTYEVMVAITDKVARKTLSPKTVFTVEAPKKA